MFDVDWFLSILDRSDMAYLCQKFRLTVTGFQRNMNNAPIKMLGNTLKTALNNGFQKKKGNKKDHLPFEIMLTDIAKDLTVKYPNLFGISFHEFAVRAELETDLNLYEIISISYHHFPKEFEKNYESIVTNTKEKRYIFYGLSEELSKSPIEKIYKMVRADKLQERNMKLLIEFENDFLQSTEVVLDEIRDLINDEESAFRVLTKADKDITLYVLVAFLLKEERYKDDTYKDLVQTTVLDIQDHKLAQLNLTTEEKDMEMKNIESKLQRLVDDISRLQEENSGLVTRLNTHIEKEKAIMGKVEELTNKISKLENILHKNEPLQMVYYRIITENDFIFITKDVDHFVGTPFESVTISPLEFRKVIKTNATHPYKEQTVFVTRSSFSNGTEWYQFKQFLEKHHLRYEELGQYEITCYIQEIIQHLSRKEVLIYADEI